MAPRKNRAAVCILLIARGGSVPTGLYFASEHFRTRADQTLLVFKADAEHRSRAAAYGLTMLALYFPLNSHKAHFSSELSVSHWVLLAIYCAAILDAMIAHPASATDPTAR